MTEHFPSAESRIARVEVYEDRVEVTRLAKARVPPGRSVVNVVGGLSPVIDDRSVRVSIGAGAGAEVLGSNVRRRARSTLGEGNDELAVMERDVIASQREFHIAAARHADAVREVDDAVALHGAWTDALARVPRDISGDETKTAWSDARATIDQEISSAQQREAVALREAASSRRALARALERLREWQGRRPTWTATVEVELDRAASESGDADVDIVVSYRCPCAVWRPEYLATLRERGEKNRGSVALETYAVVWNATGEDWHDVEISFSTARTARDASAPLLRDDVIASRRKTEAERAHVVVAEREQTIVATGIEGAARAVDEMPGVDDGGEPRRYAAHTRVSIPSDGRAHRVPLGEREIAVGVDVVAMAERAPIAHRRARGTLTGDDPILAGPIVVARDGSMVGRAKIGFVAPGEPFEIGFGAEEALRIDRTRQEERDTTTITGTQIVRRDIKLYVSNLSDTKRSLTMIERIPVSELDDVRIEYTQSGGWRHDERDGMLRTTIDVEPNSVAYLGYEYRIRAASRVVLPF